MASPVSRETTTALLLLAILGMDSLMPLPGPFPLGGFPATLSRPVELPGVVVTQGEDPALSLVEPHTIGPSHDPACPHPSAEPSWPPADQHSHQAWCHFHNDKGCTHEIIGEDTKQDWPQY